MTVKTETPHEGVILITLNRPDKLNAFDKEQRDELAHVVRRAGADDAIKVVVITGEGRAFSAGADISAMGEQYNVEDILNTEYWAFLSAIQTMPKPVIAAINGPAAGIGMTTALTCDLKVMASDAYLMSAFANIGLVPDGGLSWLLTQQVGYSRAYQLAIEAEKIHAEKALEFGLINRIAPSGEVVENAVEWAKTLSERAPISMGLTKRAFRAAAEGGMRNAMATEAMFQRSAMLTDDCKEGVTALFEKRKPAFKGR